MSLTPLQIFPMVPFTKLQAVSTSPLQKVQCLLLLQMEKEEPVCREFFVNDITIRAIIYIYYGPLPQHLDRQQHYCQGPPCRQSHCQQTQKHKKHHLQHWLLQRTPSHSLIQGSTVATGKCQGSGHQMQERGSGSSTGRLDCSACLGDVDRRIMLAVCCVWCRYSHYCYTSGALSHRQFSSVLAT